MLASRLCRRVVKDEYSGILVERNWKHENLVERNSKDEILVERDSKDEILVEKGLRASIWLPIARKISRDDGTKLCEHETCVCLQSLGFSSVQFVSTRPHQASPR